MILDIHLEGCDDNGEMFRKLAGLDKPFNISLVPVLLMPEHESFKNGVYPEDYFYNEGIVETLRELGGNPNISFGQHGFLHYCPDCFERKKERDPWHEDMCLYGITKNMREQVELIGKGKKVIEDRVGISPVFYVSGNHQSDGVTKLAAKGLGFEYFAERGIINLSPYREAGLVILPERKLGQKGEVIYTHYDQIEERFDEHIELIQNSNPLSEIPVSKRSDFKVQLNNRLLRVGKKARDWRRSS